MDPAPHPIFARLTDTQDPFARHTVLHELEKRLATCKGKRALANRVQAFVERGVPYFAPADSQYRLWAEQAAELWERVNPASAAAPAAGISGT